LADLRKTFEFIIISVMRKPYEYDINKKARKSWTIALVVIVVVAAAAFVYFRFFFPEPAEETLPEVSDDLRWLNRDFWVEVEAPLTNDDENRSPENYYNVIAQFQVETSPRYQKKDDNTFCNIFAWDIARAMNVKLPHYYKKNLMPADADDYYYTGSANVRACFLEVRGREYGWKTVDAKTAQQRANEGYLTIGVWKNTSAQADENGVSEHYPSGHIMIIRPQPTGIQFRRIKGPYISQAGEENTMLANVSDVMTFIKKTQVIYYTHD